MKLLSLAGCGALLALLMAPTAAQAQAYVRPDLNAIVKTLIRTGAVDAREDRIIDLYARVTNCPAFLKYHNDDFKWKKIREAMREEVAKDIATFPVHYAYETIIQLGRYDFDRRLYPFVGTEGADVNVNTFAMKLPEGEQNFCSQGGNRWLPLVYKLVLDKPVKISGLYIDEKEGEALMRRLDAADNPAHVVFMKINVRVLYVARVGDSKDVAKAYTHGKKKKAWQEVAVVLQNVEQGSVRLDSRLDSIDFYEDEARTKLIYTYRP